MIVTARERASNALAKRLEDNRRGEACPRTASLRTRPLLKLGSIGSLEDLDWREMDWDSHRNRPRRNQMEHPRFI